MRDARDARGRRQSVLSHIFNKDQNDKTCYTTSDKKCYPTFTIRVNLDDKTCYPTFAIRVKLDDKTCYPTFTIRIKIFENKSLIL